MFENSGAPTFGGLFADPATANGNLAVDPLYTHRQASDPRNWDLTLAAGSPVADAGESEPCDVDQSRCGFGGPDGDW